MKKINFCFFSIPALAAGMFITCTALNEQAVFQYARAKEMYAQGRFSETSDLLSETKKFAPALALRAKAEYFAGDLDKAELSCRKAMRYRPTALEAKLYLARVLRDKGDMGQAEKLTMDLLSDNPQDVRILRFASAVARQQGKAQEARLFLDQAAELSAESALVLLDRAQLHWAAGRGSEALEDLDRARAMLPWDTPLVKSIARLESSIREAVR